ncbi:MAG TPA: hypothetical protein VJM33_06170 [Microthrixaceae bacterium]|nr:hypothetical protein [Microthrixaceae bacterium]
MPDVHAPPDHLAPVISIDPDAARPTAGGERLTHWAADMLVGRLLIA